MARSSGGLITKISTLVDAENRPSCRTLTEGRVYRRRNAVDRFFNKLKQFMPIATSHYKRDDKLLASVQLVSVRIWRL